jgi:hypothetical protein
MLKWLGLAAEQGHPPAQLQLGAVYENGKFVRQDLKEAAKWYRLAAERGVVTAQANIGSMYFRGSGVPKDYVEAFKWTRLAAEQGEARSQLLLGVMHYYGDGVSQDLIAAYMWLTLAAAQGKDEAEIREDLTHRLTSSQLGAARQRIAEWRPKTASASLLVSERAFAAGEGPAVDVAVQFVIGNCYRSIDDISRVTSFARLMHWQALAPDMANALKPVDGTDYEAWQVSEQGQLFVVGVNRGLFRGRSAEICSVTVNQPPDALTPKLLGALKARRMQTNTEGLQVTDVYALEHPTQSVAAMIIIRLLNGDPPVTISFMGQK